MSDKIEVCKTCNGTGIEYDGAGHTCTACNGIAAPVVERQEPVSAVTPQQLIDAIQAEQSRLTAEDYLMDSDDCVAVIREVACLGKVKELNKC